MPLVGSKGKYAGRVFGARENVFGVLGIIGKMLFAFVFVLWKIFKIVAAHTMRTAKQSSQKIALENNHFFNRYSFFKYGGPSWLHTS